MRCPKCGFTSFPYVTSCRKCGQGLAEHQAAFGLYALRPDPPDLLVAYQATQMNLDETEMASPQPGADIDLGPLEEIDLGHLEQVPNGNTTLPLQGARPPTFDLNELGDMTLELEHAADPGRASLENREPPTGSAEVRPVYDLDLEEDLDERVLGSEVDDPSADEHDEGAVEYTLEVDDEVEVEFEIDELDVEDDARDSQEDDGDER